MSKMGKTTAERLKYRDPAAIARTPDLTSHLQGDDGIRIPLQQLPGLKEALHHFRDARRARGVNAKFTKTERLLVRALVSAAMASGWTYREVGRQLGVSGPSVKNIHMKAGS